MTGKKDDSRRISRVRLNWLGLVLLIPSTVLAMVVDNPYWIIVGGWALSVVVIPGLLERNWRKVMPPAILFSITVPFYLFVVLSLFFTTRITEPTGLVLVGWTVFLLSLVTMMEFRSHTLLRMNPSFTILFSVMLSTTAGIVLNLIVFFIDWTAGTNYLESNNELMLSLSVIFIESMLIGLLGGTRIKYRTWGRWDDHTDEKGVIRF